VASTSRTSFSLSLSLSLFTCNYCIFWWRCAGVIYAVILLTVCYLSFWNVWTTKRLLHVFPTPVHSVICSKHIHHIFNKKKTQGKREREGIQDTDTKWTVATSWRYGGSEGIAPCIFNLCITWRWVVTSMHLLPFPGDRFSNIYWAEAGWVHSPFGRHGKRRTRKEG
jgi:hypothetical protein